MGKIGRNHPCPCGSGKKYKYCHLNLNDTTANLALPQKQSIVNLINNYNSVQLISVLGALQLNAKNHGRNFRFEQLCRTVMLSFDPYDKKPLASWEILKEAVETYNEGGCMEDPLTNSFTEIAIFEEGNYLVYPGLYVGYTEILNHLIECIFLHKNELPSDFIKKVRDAVGILLFLSNQTATEAEHQPFLFEASDTGNIEFPSYDKLEKYTDAIFFSQEYVELIANRRDYDHNILSEFILTPGTKELQNEDPDNNIVNLRPFFKVDNGIVLYMPTSILSSVINFINKQSKELNCEKELAELLYRRQFHLSCVALSKMNWLATDIRLPKRKDNLPIQEAVFQFDDNKLAYLCFVNVGQLSNSNGTNSVSGKGYEKRAREVVEFLSKINPDQPMRVLCLYVLAEKAQNFFFMWSKPLVEHQTLALKFSELKTIAHSKNIEALDLWKFAKCYSRTSELTKVMATGGLIDAYAIYCKNNGSLLSSDDENPTGGMIMVVDGSAGQLIRAVQHRSNEHAVLLFHENQVGFVKVKHHRDYAPVYVENEFCKYFRIVIESYKMPIWITSRQTKANHITWATYACDAIAFWLHRMRPLLTPILKKLNLVQFEIDVKADERLISGADYEVKNIDHDTIQIEVSINAPRIELSIPFEIIYLLQLPDNSADRLLMKAVLRGLTLYVESSGKDLGMPEPLINDIIAKTLIPAHAKMILFSDPTLNVKLDDRNLPTVRYIKNADISYVLDNLTSYLPPGYIIPDKIINKDEKIKLCDDIVAAVIGQITLRLEKYNGIDLLHWLISHHEKCVQLKEFREILIPAKIACFSDLESEKDELLDADKNLVITSHAIRTLIEFVATKIPQGSKLPNRDDIDELLALTNQLTEWGALNESIRMGLDNPEMGLLPSGRIGTEKTLERNAFRPYAIAKAESEIFKNIEKFADNYMPDRQKSHVEETEETRLLDEAFLSEFSVKLTDLAKILGTMINLGFQAVRSFSSIEESQLISVLESGTGIPYVNITIALNLLTLIERNEIGKPPTDYSMADIFVWRYNRSLSYLRRPLVKSRTVSETRYHFGYRHLAAYFDNLLFLLYTSKLPNAVSPEMKTWLAGISSDKGKPFRNEVKLWFEKNTNFEVIQQEIKMESNAPKGHIKTDRSYGDIDLLVIDHIQKIIYPIECKNIIGGRNIHEMKVEMDDYLGRDGKDKKAKIRKHLDRHQWLIDNSASLGQYVQNINEYTIKSLILTADEIPLVYLKKDSLPLPVKSFVFLRKNGIQYLSKST